MIKALAIKELREIVAIAGLALAVYLALVINLTGRGVFMWFPGMPSKDLEGVPFVGNGFTAFFALVTGVYAAALGFRQSAWEDVKGTFLFLLHRPMRRDAIILTKLATGLGLLLMAGAVPILIYAMWAATPGNHPSPFEWSMTGHAWRIWFVMPLIYLGAFLSGWRPARWIGTRLLPLAAVSLAVVALVSIPWWWPLGFPLAAVLYALLIPNICYVARRARLCVGWVESSQPTFRPVVGSEDSTHPTEQ